MRGDSAQLGKADPKAVPHITLSRWINEPYPPLTELFSAHDVARLTRRPRWLLVGLELIGHFPRKARFEEELSAGGGRTSLSGWQEIWRSSVVRRPRRNRVCEDSFDRPAYRWNPAEVAPVSGWILRGVREGRGCHDERLASAGSRDEEREPLAAPGYTGRGVLRIVLRRGVVAARSSTTPARELSSSCRGREAQKNSYGILPLHTNTSAARPVDEEIDADNAALLKQEVDGVDDVLDRCEPVGGPPSGRARKEQSRKRSAFFDPPDGGHAAAEFV